MGAHVSRREISAMTNQSDLTDEAVCRELCEKYGLTTTFRHRGKILSTTVDEKAMSALSEAVRMMREKAAKCADEEGAAPASEGGSITRWDSCDNVARAIRALQLTAEDVKHEV